MDDDDTYGGVLSFFISDIHTFGDCFDKYVWFQVWYVNQYGCIAEYGE